MFVAAAVVGGVLLGILLCIVWAGGAMLFDPDPEAVIGSSRLVSTAVLRVLFLTGCGVGGVAAIVGGRRLLRNPESG